MISRYTTGSSIPKTSKNWQEAKEQWDRGYIEAYGDPDRDWKPREESDLFDADYSFEDWQGSKPLPDDYTDARPGDDLTHIVMYENTSEGTPISPKFPATEQGKRDLARWLTDNNASAFGSMTATYEQWLATINAGWSADLACIGGEMTSGVALNADQGD